VIPRPECVVMAFRAQWHVRGWAAGSIERDGRSRVIGRQTASRFFFSVPVNSRATPPNRRFHPTARPGTGGLGARLVRQRAHTWSVTVLGGTLARVRIPVDKSPSRQLAAQRPARRSEIGSGRAGGERHIADDRLASLVGHGCCPAIASMTDIPRSRAYVASKRSGRV